MSKNKRVEKRSEPRTGPPAALFFAAVALALLATGLLVADELELFSRRLPGCGFGGGCDALTRGEWGRVPALGWPVSVVGFAYFAGLAAAGIATGARIGGATRWVVRLGAAASVGYVGLMVALGSFCPYCAAAHAGNLVAWFVLERRAAPGGRAGLAPLVGVSALALLALVPSLGSRRATLDRADADRLDASVEEIVGGDAERPLLETRFVRGPAGAPIRVVMFTDYQCEDCARFEGLLEEILAERGDVSLAVKHFPMCTDCNPNAAHNEHQNACWAARAVEAAGELGGNDAFWKMHDWLFSVDGQFRAESLRPFVASIGIEPDAFERVMTDPRTLAPVRADIDEAIELGLFYTPMVFVNGTELKWYFRGTEETLRSAIERIGRAVERGETVEQAAPTRGVERFVEDWLAQPERAVRGDPAHGFGPPDAAVVVTLFGDYTADLTRRLDAAVEEAIAGRDDVRYELRPYPFNRACNPASPIEGRDPASCTAAKAALAVRGLADEAAARTFHRELMRSRPPSEGAVRAAAAAAGLDPNVVMERAESPDVTAALYAECRVFAQTGDSSPLYVDGRSVPRFKTGGASAQAVLPAILDRAAE